MKFITHFTSAIFAVIFSTHAMAELQNGNYAIDAAHSSVVFTIDHLGYTEISGRFNEFSGMVNIAEQSKLEFEIKSASIDTNHSKRDDHLRSPDFFNVKQFPVIHFKGKPTQFNDGGELVGTLSLLGVNKDVSFSLSKGKEGKDPWGLYRVGYIAKGVIKRSDFGMDFMQGGLGDDIEVKVFIEAVKQ